MYKMSENRLHKPLGDHVDSTLLGIQQILTRVLNFCCNRKSDTEDGRVMVDHLSIGKGCDVVFSIDRDSRHEANLYPQ